MKRVRAAAGVLVMACLLVGGCGESTPSTPGPTTPTPSLGTAPASPSQTVTVSGTVEEGVEAGCLLLDGYLLVGGREDGIRAGARVTVTGQAQPDLVSTCQQGTPLRVDSVRPG